MKTTLVCIALALVSLAALAPAHATPLACADPCVVSANGVGYLPPVVELASGSSIAWISTDVTHVNAEGTGIGGADTCFVATYGTTAPSAPVTFAATGSGLLADGEPCPTATALPTGGYAMAYYCVLHPLMRGALLVTTA